MHTLEKLTDGLDVTIQGDKNTLIQGVCTVQQSKAAHITFLTNPLYKKYLANTLASAVILSKEEAANCPVTAVITRNPYYVYSHIASFFDKKPSSKSGIHPSAIIGDACEIAESACIGPHCTIGNHVTISANVSLGAGCVVGDFSCIDEDSCLDANVTLYHNVRLGKRVKIASGAVLGSDGFGLAKHQGQWYKVPQLGGVVIEDDVDIGSNTSIDRGAIEDTVIKKGAKLDNLIQVGHNVTIGENTAIAGCVGIAGSAVIGKNCLIGGGTGITGHITITDNVVIAGYTQTTKSIREPGMYASGVSGLMTHLEWRKNSARVQRLKELMDRVKNLESTLKALTEKEDT